jgi:excisionase family DNA binding protein
VRDADPFQMMTLDEVAELLLVTRRTVERMVAAGDLKAFKWHNTSRVVRADFERFVQEHATRSESPRRRETLTFRQQAELRALKGQISHNEARRRFGIGQITLKRIWSE